MTVKAFQTRSYRQIGSFRGRENKANLARFLTAGAARNREIRSSKLEIRNKLEKEMIQTHKKSKMRKRPAGAPNEPNFGRLGPAMGVAMEHKAIRRVKIAASLRSSQ